MGQPSIKQLQERVTELEQRLAEMTEAFAIASAASNEYLCRLSAAATAVERINGYFTAAGL